VVAGAAAVEVEEGAVAVAQEVQAVAVALVPGEAAEQERGAEAASVRAETGEA